MTETGSPYRAAVVKRRPAPASDAPARKARAVAAEPSAEDRAAELAAEHARRVSAEVTAIRRIEAMTHAWNDELSSTVPTVASVVSGAVRSIVGEAPREDVVMNALRREVARVRGEHRPVLRISREDGEAWTAKLRERAATSEPAFDVRPDDALAPGKCLLEIGARRVELTPEAQLDAFDDHLRNGVGAIPPRPAPALPDVPAPSAKASDETTPITVDEPKPARRSIRRSIKPTTRAISLGKTSAPEEGDGRETIGTPDGTDEHAAIAAIPKSVGDAGPMAASTGSSTAPSRPVVEAAIVATPNDAKSSAGEMKQAPVTAAVPAPVEAGMVNARPRLPSAPSPNGERGPLAVRGASGRTPHEPAQMDSGRESVDAAPVSGTDNAIDFDALDLGDDAVRYESGPATETGGKAPWIGSVVAAPALADVGIEGGGSRAVAALRERVARTAGDLRREVTIDASETDSFAEAPTADATPVEGGEHAALRSADRRSDVVGARATTMLATDEATVDADPHASEREAATDERPEGSVNAMPPFAHRSREVSAPAAERFAAAHENVAPVFRPTAERDGSPAPDERAAVSGDGDVVRAALANARRRSRAERPLVSAPVPANAGGEAEAAPTPRASRLPPRIAELIAKRRPGR